MREKRTVIRRRRGVRGRAPVVLAVGLLGLLSAAGAGAGASRTTPLAPLEWPTPPEPARIRFVAELRSAVDLGRRASGFSRLLRALTGSKGRQALGLARPTDVYAEDSARVYVTDAASRQLLLFDFRARSVRALGTSGASTLSRPMGLAGDGRGHICVTDPPGRRVVVLGSSGEFVRVFGGPRTLINPVGCVVEPATGRTFVVDSYLHQVVIFDSAGTVVGRIGRTAGDAASKEAQSGEAATDTVAGVPSSGSHDVRENRGGGPGEFLFPLAVALSRDGRLYVTDGINGRVQVFDLEGRFLSQFGHLGDSPGAFARPKGIAVDGRGHVYVVDAAFNNLQVFDPHGRLLLTVGGIGRERGHFWLPLGIHIDRDDRIYVADRYNGRVQIFQYLDRPQVAADR